MRRISNVFPQRIGGAASRRFGRSVSFAFVSSRHLSLSARRAKPSIKDAAGAAPSAASPAPPSPYDLFSDVTLEDFLRGSQQVYHATGILLAQILEDMAATPLLTAIAKANGAALTIQTSLAINSALTKNFPEARMPPPPNLAETTSLDEKAKEAAAHTIEMLKATLPVTTEFAANLFIQVSKVLQKEGNILEISSPTDCIMESSVLAVGSAGGDPALFDERILTSEELKKSTSSTPLLLPKGATVTYTPAEVNVDLKDEGIVPVGYAIVQHSVVVPPQRYYSSYEWFFRRIRGHENLNERVLGAKHFCNVADSSLLGFVDFIARMITGKPMEVRLLPKLRRSLSLPDDAAGSVPVIHKVVTLLLDAKGKWYLHSINSEENLLALPSPAL